LLFALVSLGIGAIRIQLISQENMELVISLEGKWQKFFICLW
jgi:hypothetical protein